MDEPRYHDTVRVVRETWTEYLKQPVRDDDDLLALGAHSLTIALVANRLQTRLGVIVPLELCFEASVFADYATAVHRLRCTPGAEEMT
jgi:hypothetical protein